MLHRAFISRIVSLCNSHEIQPHYVKGSAALRRFTLSAFSRVSFCPSAFERCTAASEDTPSREFQAPYPPSPPVCIPRHFSGPFELPLQLAREVGGRSA